MHFWPAAVLVLTALLSGSFGAWLTSRNDLHERRRDRMLNAADDYATAASQSLLKLRNAVGEVQRARDAAAMKLATEHAWEHRDAVLVRSARISLLFGPGTPTSDSTGRFVTDLAEAIDALAPQPSPTDIGAAQLSLLDASNELQQFYKLAFAQIRATGSLSESRRLRL